MDEEKGAYHFRPKDDITAFELAQIIPILIASWKHMDEYEILRHREIKKSVEPYIKELPTEAGRHFSVEEK